MTNNSEGAETRKSRFLDSENVRLISVQAQEICKFYRQKYKIDLVKGKYVKNALIKTIRHYIAYLKEFDCRVTSVDFYKVYAWFSYFLAEELHSKDMQNGVLKVAVWIMCYTLKLNGRVITDIEMIEKILRLVQNELGDRSKFGIGKNGLYMIMKIVSIVEISNTDN